MERIHEDLQDFGRGFTRICETFGDFGRGFARILNRNLLFYLISKMGCMRGILKEETGKKGKIENAEENAIGG